MQTKKYFLVVLTIFYMAPFFIGYHQAADKDQLPPTGIPKEKGSSIIIPDK